MAEKRKKGNIMGPTTTSWASGTTRISQPVGAFAPIMLDSATPAMMQSFTGSAAGLQTFLSTGEAQRSQKGPIMAQKLNANVNRQAALFRLATDLDALMFTTLFGGYNKIVKSIQQVINQ